MTINSFSMRINMHSMRIKTLCNENKYYVFEDKYFVYENTCWLTQISTKFGQREEEKMQTCKEGDIPGPSRGLEIIGNRMTHTMMDTMADTESHL